MTKEEQQLREKYHARIRRTKFFLRYMPRRSNIHRYPVLKWFAKSARKREYLWSFRTSAVTPAFYIGWILTLLPVIGAQMTIGTVLAFLFRANLMVVIGLQWVSNPLTVAPLWALNYVVGNAVIRLFSSPHVATIEQEALDKISATGDMASTGQDAVSEVLKALPDSIVHENSVQLAQGIFHFFLSISVGGIILGVLMGFISSLVYKIISKRTSPLKELRELARKRKMEVKEPLDREETQDGERENPDPFAENRDENQDIYKSD